MKYERHIHHSKLSILDPDFSATLDAVRKKADEKFNGFVKVTVSTPARTRTTGENSQNHHLNGHIQYICQETGNDFDDVKKYVKQKAISMGYPMLERDGKVVLDMWGSPMGISEADSSVEECAILIEAVHQLASELGIAQMPEE
jgi:hypothetical protein